MATNHDVIFGKGNGRNPGNQYWVHLVRQHLEEYNQATNRNETRSIAKSVIYSVHQNGGRFLKKDGKNGGYMEMTKEEKLHKTRQCFVDLNHRGEKNRNEEPPSSIQLAPDEVAVAPDASTILLTPEERLDQQLHIRRETQPEEVSKTYNALAGLLFKDGKLEEDQELYQAAIRQYQKVLAIHLKVHGPDHSETADTYHNIGHVLCQQDMSEDAMDQYKKGLEIRLKLHGTDHLSTADSYHCMGMVLFNQAQYEEAMQLYQKALAIKVKMQDGPEDSSMAASHYCIGNVLRKQGKERAALENYHKALAIFLKVDGRRHPSTASTYHSIGEALCNQGNYDDAMDQFQIALDIKFKLYGTTHSSTLSTYRSMENILRKQAESKNTQVNANVPEPSGDTTPQNGNPARRPLPTQQTNNTVVHQLLQAQLSIHKAQQDLQTQQSTNPSEPLQAQQTNNTVLQQLLQVQQDIHSALQQLYSG
ncbi:unnamed protein product [Cylindrotheca closterium]|uniref:DUF6824 domain-containing protein n=1 Tax=Cylindrotheca closterium TaxID=2856 RepID=A0AAD2FQX8_9STRA|nr:unnamed protein product [Cylindrotheca closterium]